MKSMISPLTLLLVFAAPAAIAAEDIYRSTLPDGRVMYGESPYPGAKSVRKIAPPPISTGMTYVTPEEKSRGAPPPVTTTRGGVGVIPAPAHQVPVPAQQGQLQSDRTSLPARGY
jgi:hypothetical protein